MKEQPMRLTYPAGTLRTDDSVVHGKLVYVSPYWVVVEPHLSFTDGELNAAVYIWHERIVVRVTIPPLEVLESTLRGEEPDAIGIRWPTDAEVEAHVASIWRTP